MCSPFILRHRPKKKMLYNYDRLNIHIYIYTFVILSKITHKQTTKQNVKWIEHKKHICTRYKSITTKNKWLQKKRTKYLIEHKCTYIIRSISSSSSSVKIWSNKEALKWLCRIQIVRWTKKQNYLVISIYIYIHNQSLSKEEKKDELNVNIYSRRFFFLFTTEHYHNIRT
jgi:hypothetical protein